MFTYAEISSVVPNTVLAINEAPFIPRISPGAGRFVIDVTEFDSMPNVGDLFVDGAFVSPPPISPSLPVPVLTLTSLSLFNVPPEDMSAISSDQLEVTMPLDAGVNATFEIQVDDGTGNMVTAPIDIPMVRMPVTSVDGWRIYLVFPITQGTGTVSWTPQESGRWQITQDNINSELPPDMQMSFVGLDIFVYEV